MLAPDGVPLPERTDRLFIPGEKVGFRVGGSGRDREVLERDPIDLVTVQAINAIGHVMGLKTIAEFVESESVLQRLSEIGLDYAQGYHLGEPKPLTDDAQVKMMPR